MVTRAAFASGESKRIDVLLSFGFQEASKKA